MSNNTSKPEQKQVNVAVVGLGFMGVTHLIAYLDNPLARVVAVCDAVRTPENGVLRGVAGNIKQAGDIRLPPDVKVFRSLDEVLADASVQLVDICTPTPLHPEQVIAALKAGKHVLCEKPLARTAAAARKILPVAKESPGMLMPAMCMRFWPGWAWLRQVVDSQTYGRVLAARFRRVSEMPAWSRNGTYAKAADSGGALFDLHIHDVDFVNYLFGRPDKVFATGVVDAAGTINHVVAQYQFAEGPVVHAEGSWLLAHGFNMSYTMHCERATVDFDLARGNDALQVSKPGEAPESLPIDGADGYGEEILYMLNCVVRGRAPQAVTAYDGVTALDVCEAAELSIRTGTVVTLR